MAKINYGAEWTKVADGEVTKVKDEKTETVCELFGLADAGAKTAVYFLLPGKDGMKGLAVNFLANSLLEQVKSIGQIIVLREMYRMQYNGPEETDSRPDGQLLLKTHRTSHLPAGQVEWLQSKVGKPASFTVPVGGMGARLICHAQMHGMSAYAVTAITEEHYVSAESMQAYTSVMDNLGLNAGNFELKNIKKRKDFRELLKEANSRDHNIFS
jgi:hypothetical protein